ncbi:6608_t:CDS:2, partial [Racocetra persica]
FGRRPILLIGLLGNMIACLFFGLSKSLIWAIASRATCGMLNANIGVQK